MRSKEQCNHLFKSRYLFSYLCGFLKHRVSEVLLKLYPKKKKVAPKHKLQSSAQCQLC